MPLRDNMLRLFFAAVLAITTTTTLPACESDEGGTTDVDTSDDTSADTVADSTDDTGGDTGATEDTTADTAADTEADTNDDTSDDTDGVEDAADTADAADTTEDASDGSGDVADTADGSGESSAVAVTFHFEDFITEAPLEGYSVQFGDVTETVDASGNVTLTMEAGAPYQLVVTGSGSRPQHIYAWAPFDDGTTNYSLATNATIAAMEVALEQDVDDADGLISVAAREVGTRAQVPGVTIDIDATYDFPLAFDSTADAGFSLGNTTLADSSSTVIFVNVDPSTVTPSFSGESITSCDVGPESFAVPSGSYVIVEYRCTTVAD